MHLFSFYLSSSRACKITAKNIDSFYRKTLN